MNPTSLTLSRSKPCAYQVTYWDDGIARWDAPEGDRIGAWQAAIPIEWFRRIAPLAKALRTLKTSGEPDVTILVSDPSREVTHSSKNGRESDGLWLLATLLDGMAARTQWAPFDTTGKLDLAPWVSGMRMNFVKGPYAAQALARPEGLVVLAGSQLATSTAATLESPYKNLRSALAVDGSLELQHDCFILTRHLFFRAPSAAASVVAGSNTNGRYAWRDQSGRMWSDLGLDQ